MLKSPYAMKGGYKSMVGSKYVVAALENSVQVGIRNILNPCGYVFLGNCHDPISLLRLIRSVQPDFAIIDLDLQLRELRTTIETIDDELLCSCVLIGGYKDIEMLRLLEKSSVISFCPKPINRDVVMQTVELSVVNYRRITELSKKLKEMEENLETRKVIDRAKWILAERDKISENEAYEKIRRKSMDTRMPMKEIANAIIIAYEVRNE